VNETDTPPTQEAPLILVADDSPTALKVTSSVLIEQGYRVAQVADGLQAVEATMELQPAAIVVDLKMPKMDGYEVCLHVKQEKNRFIPILLLTAREDIESLVKGLESGADDYIIKPFNEMEFIARIKVLLRLKMLNDDLLEANKKLKYLSTRDELTGMYNHRYFIHMLHKLSKSCQAEAGNLCLVIFDLDHFKKINDTYGHLEGDRALRTISAHLQKSFTKDATLARYGGEEFIALFPNRSQDTVIKEVQACLDSCARITLQCKNQSYHVTLSAGISSSSHIRSYDPNTLIQRADNLLYVSKRSGRNRLSHS
jgi:two-component system cell cycle response regulator